MSEQYVSRILWPKNSSGSVGLAIKRWRGWKFRDQPVEDYGVDCEAEAPGVGYPSGRLIGIQVKTGQSYFKPAADGSGWWFSPDAKPSGKPDPHLRYWIENDRRVVLVLVDDTTQPETAYWVHVKLDRVEFTGASWKILVPKDQMLDASAQTAFQAIIAAPRSAESEDLLGAATDFLPPQAGAILSTIAEAEHFRALQLAVRLGRGRHAPAEECAKLLGADRRYLEGAEGRLYLVVAMYAAAHGCHAQAAEAFVGAGAYDVPESPRYQALAAWSLVGVGDRTQARLQLDRAETAGAPPILCRWIRAVVDFESPGFPQVARELEEATRADPNAPMHQFFLGQAALVRRDFSAALRWLDGALVREPDNSAVMLEVARALLEREAASRSPLPGANRTRALQLAQTARDQRRRWNGPSQEAALEMIRALQMASDFPAVLQIAAPPPLGEATISESTISESTSGQIAFLGVRAALALENKAGALLIASQDLPDCLQTRAIKLMLDADSESSVADNWLGILAEAEDDSALLVYAMHRAAATGMWPIAEIEQRRADGYLTDEGYEILRARSHAAKGDLDAAERTLRPLIADSAIAAESFIEILEDAGQLDRAAAKCDTALRRFRITPLAVKQWNLLVRLDRTKEAIERAASLLSRPDMPPALRATLRMFLVGEANNRHDWATVEEHCQAAIHEDPDRAPFAWMYIGAAYNRRDWKNAWERLYDLDPPISTTQEAGLWVALHAYHGFSEQDVLDALDLIDRFPSDDLLRGQIVTTLLQCGNKVTPDGSPVLPTDAPLAQARFQEALTAFLETEPAGLRTIASGSAEKAIIEVRDALASRASLDLVTHAGLRDGLVALAAICYARRTSYVSALLQRSIGPITAVTQHADSFEAELHDAAEALDGPVIIEASSLAVLCELPERLPTIRSAFTEHIVDDDTRFQCVTACADVREAPGTVSAIGLADDGQSLVLIEPTDADIAARIARADTLERFLPRLDSPPVADGERPPPHDAARPWLGPAFLAQAQDVPLWCDDVALRREARALGCRTFGTVALLHVLAEADELSDTELRQDMIRLAKARVADIYLDSTELVSLSDGFSGFPGPAAEILARPGFWLGTGSHAAVALMTGVSEIIQPRSPVNMAAWFQAVCEGVAGFVAQPRVTTELRSIAVTVARAARSDATEQQALISVADLVAEAEIARRAAMSGAIVDLQNHSTGE